MSEDIRQIKSIWPYYVLDYFYIFLLFKRSTSRKTCILTMCVFLNIYFKYAEYTKLSALIIKCISNVRLLVSGLVVCLNRCNHKSVINHHQRGSNNSFTIFPKATGSKNWQDVFIYIGIWSNRIPAAWMSSQRL